MFFQLAYDELVSLHMLLLKVNRLSEGWPYKDLHGAYWDLGVGAKAVLDGWRGKLQRHMTFKLEVTW